MPGGTAWPWLPRILYGLAVLLALVLVAIVLVAPALDPGTSRSHGWQRLLAVFARDTTLRRTAVASAVGLFATASVFFGKHSRPEQAD